MARANNQTIALVALISGCLTTINDYTLDKASLPLTLYAKDACDTCVLAYPADGNDQKNVRWISGGMNKFDKKLNDRPDEKYDASLLTAMCSQILTDLKDKITDKKKLELIEPVAEAINALSDKLHPPGSQDGFQDFERADELLEIAYDCFGFSV